MKELRTNVLALTLIATALVVILSLWLEANDLAMLAASIIGAIGATMTKLVDPPAPDPDPAVPASTVKEILEFAIAQRNISEAELVERLNGDDAK